MIIKYNHNNSVLLEKSQEKISTHFEWVLTKIKKHFIDKRNTTFLEVIYKDYLHVISFDLNNVVMLLENSDSNCLSIVKIL